MDRMKTFFKYAMIILAFYIFSNFIINVGLNMRYKKITAKDNIVTQVTIMQAEATKVNGRIKGKVKNLEENNVNGKYIKIDLYTKNNILMGTKYIAIKDIKIDEQDDFEVYFKLQDVKYYDISIVDEVTQKVNDDAFLDEDLKTTAIIALLFYLCLV